MSAQRRFIVLGSFLLLLPAAPLAAQTWSPQQRDVLAVVEESWVDDLGKDSTWVNRLTHPELMAWNHTIPVPRDQAATRRWTEYGHENSTALIQTIAPVAIAVRGDAAVVHYYATVAAEDRDGKRETTTSRCTDTLTRDDGAWKFLGWFCYDEPSEGSGN